MKKILIFSMLAISPQAYSMDNVLEFKFEKRGDHFERHFVELHNAWGQQGWGLLNTTLERNSTMTQLGATTNIHPGFTYLFAITQHFSLGVAAKYNYVVETSDAIKLGLGWAYSGFEYTQLAGQVRYDHQLGDSSFDLVRTDIIVSLPLSKYTYFTTTSTNMSPVEGDVKAWQEYELEFKYTGFDGIHPYFATTITTNNDPLGQGDNAFIFGFYIPLS